MNTTRSVISGGSDTSECFSSEEAKRAALFIRAETNKLQSELSVYRPLDYKVVAELKEVLAGRHKETEEEKRETEIKAEAKTAKPQRLSKQKSTVCHPFLILSVFVLLVAFVLVSYIKLNPRASYQAEILLVAM
eukprot:TRINITY_DN12237_c0_g1_i1.p1 TRINITY_DN12237_c0_g1~~TRINITY_DN12237_c0_g1_i1.p1  ORF type:complete len:134 (+),score=29.52 TRINITY_DN12237_c0_g1_i1:114-515(+)